MDYFSWLAQEDLLSSEALTVRAQALPPDDRDQLVHDVFFPRQNVPSVKLSSIEDIDFRPISDRREWNTRGRHLHSITPRTAELEMIPIEDYFKIEEREMQELVERTFGNEALIRQIVRSSIPARIDALVQANRRRMEYDALRAWATGSIAAKNPQTGVVTTVSYSFDVNRFQTAGTAWNNGAVNAYNEFLAWLEDGIDAVGSAIGAIMRRATFTAIQADAPQGLDAIPLTRAQVQDRISQDLGIPFTFYLLEHRADLYTDGGLTTTRTNYWPAEQVALVPAGAVVGNMAYAPQVRGFSLARVAQDAQIDVNGMAVYREIGGNGRDATWECQVNAFPIPLETRMWVIDAGV